MLDVKSKKEYKMEEKNKNVCFLGGIFAFLKENYSVILYYQSISEGQAYLYSCLIVCDLGCVDELLKYFALEFSLCFEISTSFFYGFS